MRNSLSFHASCLHLDANSMSTIIVFDEIAEFTEFTNDVTFDNNSRVTVTKNPTFGSGIVITDAGSNVDIQIKDSVVRGNCVFVLDVVISGLFVDGNSVTFECAPTFNGSVTFGNFFVGPSYAVDYIFSSQLIVTDSIDYYYGWPICNSI